MLKQICRWKWKWKSSKFCIGKLLSDIIDRKEVIVGAHKDTVILDIVKLLVLSNDPITGATQDVGNSHYILNDLATEGAEPGSDVTIPAPEGTTKMNFSNYERCETQLTI